MTMALRNPTTPAPGSPPGTWWSILRRVLSTRRLDHFRQTEFGAKAKSLSYKRAYNETLVLDHKAIETELQAYRRGAEDGASGYPLAGQVDHDRFHRDLIASGLFGNRLRRRFA